MFFKRLSSKQLRLVVSIAGLAAWPSLSHAAMPWEDALCKLGNSFWGDTFTIVIAFGVLALAIAGMFSEISDHYSRVFKIAIYAGAVISIPSILAFFGRGLPCVGF